MKTLLPILFLLTSVRVIGQPISTSNLSHWYDPEIEDDFKLKIVNGHDSVYACFKVDTAAFEVQWEMRESYGQRLGSELTPVSGTTPEGRLAFEIPAKPWLLIASLKNKKNQERRLYFKVIEANYPVNGVILFNNKVHFRPFLTINTPYQITGPPQGPLNAYYYKGDFPAGSPPFAETDLRVDPLLKADSTFQIESGAPLTFTMEGLYLIQADTNAANGISFRVTGEAFPKTSRMEDLAAPLIFLCTKEEYENLIEAGNDKTKFDRVILGIARDKDRAKSIMRNYFRRVELANMYFTSYKEGWKTDRGMIYLIFGLPDEVSRTGENEIWYYKSLKARFIFVKSGSLYDPDNYVLVRDKRFRETWYYTIDMWRKDMTGSKQRK